VPCRPVPLIRRFSPHKAQKGQELAKKNDQADPATKVLLQSNTSRVWLLSSLCPNYNLDHSMN
jgi:hypothetical protein